ncbi:hypothetical protein DACRYDRAFT_18236 [Dacryopinax primogenitus]|uniref:Uncharacterized protein n=1 Tax=Dacryopinax primogenitus (strain DJM 731) TaxID=1858805 RepID=M5FXF1_DACPD|nr:uncharacterized protein DACRYDRAFT_18236 [Dacryopinax primogenitus]EJT98161.1 hypothetical protein DACRYDRAFT_18236 [Dacryopinax primogenitus]
MAARQDAERLRALVQGDSELIKAAMEYLARLRLLASTVGSLRDNATALAPIAALLACEENGSDMVTPASAQKASFRRPGEFQNCLKAVRSLLVRQAASSSPQQTPSRPSTTSFEALASSYRKYGVGRGAVQEMNRAMQEWERLLDKAKGGKHTAVEDPRYTKAIFVWVLIVLKFPIDKTAFCAEQNMRQVDLTNIHQSLDSRCFGRKAALEKKKDLHYQGPSPEEQDSTSPTKAQKRKASAIDMPDELVTPTKRPYTPSLLSGKRDSPSLSANKRADMDEEELDSSPTKRLTRSATGTQITPSKPFRYNSEQLGSSRTLLFPPSAESTRSVRSSNPFSPSPTKSRGKSLSPEPMPMSSSGLQDEEEDEREGYSPLPEPKYRLRPLFLETFGLSKKDNLREVEWFRAWRAQVIKRGFESDSEDEFEVFEEEESVRQEHDEGASVTDNDDDQDYEED